MYEIGDLILYGGTGVCRVTDITAQGSAGGQKDQLYYVLEPLYQNCTIFTPVHATKVFMRPIISKSEAEQLIEMIPGIRVEAYHSRALNELTEHYKKSLNTHDCSNLMELTMSIYAKKQSAEEQKRKFGAVDERYMKLAEDLLFGELSAALDIPKEKVSEFIVGRMAEKRVIQPDAGTVPELNYES